MQRQQVQPPGEAGVIILGGGVIGLSLALALAEAGLRPLLIEARSFGGAVTAGSLAGIGVHMHGMAEFHLMTEACRLWRDLAAKVGNPFEYNPQGQIGFILDQEGMESGEAWVAEESALGAPCRLLTPAQLREIEPGLTGPVLGATWAPDSATVNPFFAARTLLRLAREAGALAFEHCPAAALLSQGGRITGVRLANGQEIRADHTILAAGPWSQEIAAPAGVMVPLRPRQAQCLVGLRQPPGTIRHVVSAVERRGGVDAGYTQIQQSVNGQILFNTVITPVDSGAAGRDRINEVPASFVTSSIDMLVRLFPALADLVLLRSWVRFEAVSPDARFMAGRLAPEGLWICAGDNGSGYCRALMLGRYLAGEISGNSRAGLAPDLVAQARALYAPARFSQQAA
ncbi:FAD-binding oxidoreductase [Paracoccus sp. IB05]|uniref:NAD(P)/FAD-dependent oxidoreductase n=1 Tax=Paracoccus sp. IB05 TaxID=2779367 RepID=UPI001E3B8303|nr:FAD-binding oxidoreductase [Paracoccus sp. IB05]